MKDSSHHNSTWAAAQTVLVLGFLGAIVALAGPMGIVILTALAYYVLCFLRPSAGLAWAFAFLPLSVPEFSVAGVTIRPFELFVWPAAIIAVLATIHEKRTPPWDRAKTLMPAALFVVYVLVECVLLWGATSAVEMRFWASSFLVMVAFFLRADDEQTLQHLYRSMTAGACVMLGVAVSQRLFEAPFFLGMVEPRDLLRLVLLNDRTPVVLANSTFPHPNAAGAYLTVAISMLCAASIGRKSRIAMVGAAASLVALYLTYSRGAGLAALGSLVALAFVISGKPQRWLLLGAVGTAALAVLVLVVLASSVAEYWLTFSLGVRYLIWGAYFHVWLSSPLIGVGPGNSFVQAQFLSPYGGQYAAHNNYLYLATDFGALGLLGAMWLFGNAVVVMLRRRSQKSAMSEVGAGVVGAVVALAIQSLVDHTLGVIAYRAALLAVLGLAIGLPVGSSVEMAPQTQPAKSS